jgi:hypothetical protein
MSATEDKLYRLIHTLDRSEKGYIRKFAALHTKEDANTLKVFDLYNKVLVYDKKKIDELVSKEKFAENIAKVKSYLYDLILKALHNFHVEKKDKNRLRMQMIHVEMLKDKGLTKDALSILSKVKKEAIEKEMYFLLPDVFSLEINLQPHLNIDFNKFHDKINEIKNEAAHYKKCQEAIQYFIKALGALETHFHSLLFSPEKEIQQKAKEIFEADKYKEFLLLESYQINIFKELNQAYLHLIIPDAGSFRKHAAKALQLLAEENISNFNHRVRLQFLYNLGNCCLCINDETLYKQAVDGLKSVKNKMADPKNPEHNKALSYIHYTSCNYFIRSGKYEEGLQNCEEFLNKESRNTDTLNEALFTTYYSQSLLFFIAGKYSAAIKSANFFDLVNNNSNSLDFESELFIVKILSHLEMNNWDTAKILGKQYLGFYERKNLRFEQRKIFVKNILKISAAEKTDLATMTLENFTKNKIEDDQKNTFPLLDLSAWCVSVLTNNPLAEVLSKKFKEKSGG